MSEQTHVSLRKKISRRLWTAALAFIGLVGAPFIIALFTELGAYNTPVNKVKGVLQFLKDLFYGRWFIAVGGLLLGLAIGASIDIWLRRREGRVQPAIKALEPQAITQQAPAKQQEIKPDLLLNELLERIYKPLRPLPSVLAQESEIKRRINHQIADTVAMNGLHVWGRVGDKPLSKIEGYEWRAGILNHELRCLKVPHDFGHTEYKDLRFNRSEVDVHWPPEKEPTPRDKVGNALNEGTHLYQEQLSHRDKYPEWKEKLDTWVESTAQTLQREYGEADKQLFLMLPQVPAVWVGGSISDTHSWERLHLSSRLTTLRGILTRG